jgi:phage gpG-like protein
MPNIVAKTYGEKLIARKLENLAARAEDMRPIWPAVVERAREGFEYSFRAQGPGWPPLRPSTVRSRVAQGFPGAPILQKTGRLKASFTSGLSWRATGHSITFFSNVPYAKYHQTGTASMPQRRVQLTVWIRRSITQIIGSELIRLGYV